MTLQVTLTTYFNPVATTKKLRTFKLLRWVQNLNQSTWDHEIFAFWQILKR
jgi:hypothetical protein